MKTPYFILFAVATVFLTACSTMFTEYRGQSVVDGKGGTVRVVDGIEFWENGEPNRRYQILGVIDDSRRESLLVPGKDRAIAKVAIERGADAVILTGSSRELRGINLNNGVANYTRVTKVLAVKYVR